MLFTSIISFTLLGQALGAAFFQLTKTSDKTSLFPKGSSVQGYEQYTEVGEWSLGSENNINLASGSGSGVGKVQFTPLTITRKIDYYSPVLFRNLAAGVPMNGKLVVLSNNPDRTGGPPLQYTFGGIYLTDIDQSLSDEGLGTEILKFVYTAVTITVKDASSAQTNTAGWNQVTNVECKSTDASTCVNTKSARSLFGRAAHEE